MEDQANPPEDYIKMKLNLNLPRFSFELLREYVPKVNQLTMSDIPVFLKRKMQTLLKSSLNNLAVAVIMHPVNMTAVVDIEGYNVAQRVLDCGPGLCPFPNLVEAGHFHIDFKQTPNSGMATMAVEVIGESVNVFVLLDVLIEVALEMKKAVVDEFDVEGYAEEAMSAAQEYMEAGEAQMDKMKEMAVAARIFANIHIKAPVIQIPYDSMSNMKPSVFLDLGGVKIETEMAEKYTGGNLSEVTDMRYIYDRFDINLSGIRAYVFWPEDIDDKIGEWEEDILRPFEFGVNIG
jgi:hypothetical protein